MFVLPQGHVKDNSWVKKAIRNMYLKLLLHSILTMSYLEFQHTQNEMFRGLLRCWLKSNILD